MFEDKASKLVAEMEDRKARYKAMLEDLNSKNHSFIEILEKLTKQHGSLVDSAA